jgi:uncharacterized protein YdaU (DUF1376 family)
MKDPAFLFYPADWTLGTMHMTLQEKGAYIELLMLQFARGKFTEAHAKHMLNGSFDLVWPNVVEKFKTDGQYYWNERLEIEKTKRAKFTESRRSNGLKKGLKEETNGKHMLEHMHKHMGNINIDINNIGGVGEKNKNPSLNEVIEFFKNNGYCTEKAKQAFNYYQEANWHDSKNKKVKNWKQKMRGVWFTDENKAKPSMHPKFETPVLR